MTGITTNWKKLAGFTLAGLGAFLVTRNTGAQTRALPSDSSGTRTRRPSNDAVTINGGLIRAPRARDYRLTRSDQLWLGRALVGEVSEQASGWRNSETLRGGEAVAWALAQNFMLIGRNPPRFATFEELVRAYCQPVNPLWSDPNSSKCRSHPEACSQTRLDRRRRITSMAWSDLPQEVRDLLEAWSAGRVSNPVPWCTDWHAEPWPGEEITIAGNHFGHR